MNFLKETVLLTLFLLTKTVASSDDYGDLFGSEETTNIDYEIFNEPTTESTTTKRATSRPIALTTESAAYPLTTEASDYDWDRDWKDDEEICELGEKCVAYYLCKEDKKIITDGAFLIDERFDGPKPTVPACPSMERCCSKEEAIRPTEIPTKGICDDIFATPSKCGFRNLKGLGGMVLSMQNKTLYSQYAEFPWMVAVLIKRLMGDKNVDIYQSGGSLIHPKIVLTTAHNIVGIDPKTLVARAGEWDTQSEKEMCKHEERNVQRVIKHENFHRSSLRNDVALLVLTSEFPMTPFINTICLPPAGMSFNGQRCWASGWGKTLFGKAGVYQVFLKKLDLPIVPNERCQTLLRNTRLGEDFELHEGFLCAGGEERRDTCTGDGGSPLVCEIREHPGHYYQAGIVVGGVGCGEKDIPGFYASVAKYREWIDRKLSTVGIDHKTYTY